MIAVFNQEEPDHAGSYYIIWRGNELLLGLPNWPENCPAVSRIS